MLKLNESNEPVLGRQLQAARARFAVGEVARSNLVVATRNEIVASMELRQMVGTLTAQALALPGHALRP